MCKYLAWRSRSSGCLESCDIGFQKAGMQVKLFLECSQSPDILRSKFRPTTGSSNDRSEKSKKSECVKCGSVYTVQYLGRKKERKKNNKNWRKNVQVRNLSTSYEWKSSRCQRWGAQSRTWAHAATHSTHIGSSQSRIVAEAALGGDKRVAHASRLEAVVDLLRLAVSQIPSFSAVCTL